VKQALGHGAEGPAGPGTITSVDADRASVRFLDGRTAAVVDGGYARQ